MRPDFFVSFSSAIPACRNIGIRISMGAVMGIGIISSLSGCAVPPPETSANTSAPAPAAPPAPAPIQQPSPAPATQPNFAAIARQKLIDQPLQSVLDYADQVRLLNATQASREINRLSPLAEQADPEVQPQRQLQLALALLQTRGTPDLVRAIGLTQRVQETNTPITRQLQPLARLLQQRLTEQRRSEDASDRQSQQLRDMQRRMDAAQDRLDALKAIERSLHNSRPGAGGPPPLIQPEP